MVCYPRQHKKEKKEKKEKKHKKHKRSHHDDVAGDVPVAPAKVDNPISEDDYFARTAEFQMWLKEARGAYLDELQSEEARKLFKQRFLPVRWAWTHSIAAACPAFTPSAPWLQFTRLTGPLRAAVRRSGMAASCLPSTTRAAWRSLRRAARGTSGGLPTG